MYNVHVLFSGCVYYKYIIYIYTIIKNSKTIAIYKRNFNRNRNVALVISESYIAYVMA